MKLRRLLKMMFPNWLSVAGFLFALPILIFFAWFAWAMMQNR